MSNDSSSHEAYQPLLRLEVGLALLLAGGLWIEVSGWPDGLPLVSAAALGLVLVLALWEIGNGVAGFWRRYNGV